MIFDDDVVERAAVQGIGDVLEELPRDRVVDRVEQDGLLVKQDVGIVAHAAGDGVDALKQCQPPVRRADPKQIVIDFHCAVHE